MAVAIGKPCITLLKTGEPNPLGSADLGYSERSEYSSKATLKDVIRRLLIAKSSALRALDQLSYSLQSDHFKYDREELAKRLLTVANHVYRNKSITKAGVSKIVGGKKEGGIVVNGLREAAILKMEGQRKAAKYIFGDAWVTHDHEVVGAP